MAMEPDYFEMSCRFCRFEQRYCSSLVAESRAKSHVRQFGPNHIVVIEGYTRTHMAEIEAGPGMDLPVDWRRY